MEHSLTTPNRERSGLAALLHPFVERRTYLSTIDLLLDLAFGVLWFTLFTTLIATGLGTLILLIGPPLLVATLLLARAGGWFERRRARRSRSSIPIRKQHATSSEARIRSYNAPWPSYATSPAGFIRPC